MDSNKTPKENEHWDDIYQKIGRCVVLFQKIELLFKYAVSRGCFSLVLSTNPSSISPIDQLKNNANTFSQKTMGCVGRIFCDRILTDNGYSPEGKELSKDEMRLNVSFNYGTNDRGAALKSKIESIITERNKVVHQLFNTLKFDTNDDFINANAYLDAIYNDTLTLYDEIDSIAKSIPEAIKHIFSNSDCNLFQKYNKNI